jgi:hypothetical protein
MKIKINDSWELQQGDVPEKFKFDGETVELETIEDLIELDEYIRSIVIKRNDRNSTHSVRQRNDYQWSQKTQY